MPDELAVLVGGEHIATLTDVGLGLGASLTYTPAAVARYGEGRLVLSVHLPVRAEPYPATDASAFLDGLLPEEHVRSALADKARLPVGDTLGLLRQYGLDCAGAVQIRPVHDPAGGEVDDPSPRVHWLDEDELDEAVRRLPSSPLGIDIDDGVRSSLGGLQGKLPLVVRQSDGAATPLVGVPVDGRASTHILKPARLLEDGGEEWPGIVAAECFGLRVVDECYGAGGRIAAAQATPFELKSRSALLVTRYDRLVHGDGTVTRLHQEDAAQALGIRDKYQRTFDRPPRLVDIAALLNKAATVPAIQRVALLEVMTLNAVLGNCDFHARNLSLLLTDGRVELAPAYDVVPTCAWPRHSRELSLRVGGEAILDDLTREHLLKEAESWGIRPRAAATALDRTLTAAGRAIELVVAQAKEQDWFHPVVDEATAQAKARLTKFS